MPDRIRPSGARPLLARIGDPGDRRTERPARLTAGGGEPGAEARAREDEQGALLPAGWVVGARDDRECVERSSCEFRERRLGVTGSHEDGGVCQRCVRGVATAQVEDERGEVR